MSMPGGFNNRFRIIALCCFLTLFFGTLAAAPPVNPVQVVTPEFLPSAIGGENNNVLWNAFGTQPDGFRVHEIDAFVFSLSGGDAAREPIKPKVDVVKKTFKTGTSTFKKVPEGDYFVVFQLRYDSNLAKNQYLIKIFRDTKTPLKVKGPLTAPNHGALTLDANTAGGGMSLQSKYTSPAGKEYSVKMGVVFVAVPTFQDLKTKVKTDIGFAQDGIDGFNVNFAALPDGQYWVYAVAPLKNGKGKDVGEISSKPLLVTKGQGK